MSETLREKVSGATTVVVRMVCASEEMVVGSEGIISYKYYIRTLTKYNKQPMQLWNYPHGRKMGSDQNNI